MEAFQLGDPYKYIITRVSTPHGFVQVGWHFERKTRRSNITCSLCQKYVAKDKRELVLHIRKEHPEIFRFIWMTGHKQMII